jgi:hypothetical protein
MPGAADPALMADVGIKPAASSSSLISLFQRQFCRGSMPQDLLLGKINGMPLGGRYLLTFKVLYKTTVNGNQKNEAMQYFFVCFLSSKIP